MNEKELYNTAIGEHLAPYDRIYKTALRNGRKPRTAPRIAMILAACLVVAVVTVACIPEARAAVLRWLSPATDPATHLTTPAEERPTDNPALDAAIEPADAVAITVVDAADAEWQAWAEALTVTFDELLYDGETLHITGGLTGNTSDMAKPMSAYTETVEQDGITHSPPDDMVTVSARWRLGDGDWVYTLINALAVIPGDEVPASGVLPLLVNAHVGKGLTGEQAFTLELLFCDMGTLRQNPVEGNDYTQVFRVALRADGMTFDATPGTGIQQSLTLPAPAALTGDALVFSGEENARDGSAEVGNDRLSLEGGMLALVQMQQQLTGTRMAFCLTLPAAWTDRQCDMFTHYMSVEFVVDGENQGGFGGAYTSMQFYDGDSVARLGLDAPPDVSPHVVVFSVETLLMPEDWARIGSLHAVLVFHEMTVYNDVPVPTGSRAAIVIDPGGWQEDTTAKRFTDCPLVVR